MRQQSSDGGIGQGERAGARRCLPIAAAGLLLITVCPALAALPGDCNDDGQVTVSELITGVNIALGNAALGACAPLDVSGDGTVGINELVQAVSAALGLLPATVTPTPSPSPPATGGSVTVSPTPTDPAPTPTNETPTRSPTATAPATATATASATVTGTATATATVTGSMPPSATAVASRTATQTRTPTDSQACSATPIPGDSEVSVSGSTAGAADTAGGASCGFGGGEGAPDAVYEYVAPAAGVYDIATRDATFPVYLFVRGNSCDVSESELACADSPSDAAVTLSLASGQRVAIVVDGSTPTGGAFTLEVRRRQADLVVASVTVPPQANAGGQIAVMAEIENAGTAAAGAFSVEFFWARGATLADRLGTAVTRCAIGGLVPGARALCQPLNPLAAPLVAEDAYLIGVRVDETDVVDERREDNNSGSAPCAMQVAGAELQHELYRARDGTAYQVIAAVPRTLPTASDHFRITALTGVEAGVESCATLETQPGSVARAVVGADPAPPLGSIMRTALLRPNDAAQVTFDPAAGGRLLLGSGNAAVAVCENPFRCGGVGTRLLPAAEATGGVPGACVAPDVPGARCGEESVGAAVVFPSPPGLVCEPTNVTAETEICAAEPRDGFVLHAGEAIVFVYTPGRGALQTAVAGFGISGAGGAAGCAAERVVAARASLVQSEPRPLLSLAGTLSEVDPQALARPAFSPDGRHLYAGSAGIGALAAFSVAEDGSVELLELQRQSERGVEGLTGAGDAVVSPDGRHVYIVGAGSVAAFRRDTQSGRLTFVQARRNGIAGVQGIAVPHTPLISPDGAYLYVASSDALAVFRRDLSTGTLTFVEAQRDGIEAPAVLTRAAMSPDGAFVYAIGTDFAAPDAAAVLVFQRDSANGRLSFVAAQRDGMTGISGLAGATAIALSPDGLNAYVIPLVPSDLVVTALSRDPTSGLLTTVGAYAADGSPAVVFNSILSVAVSPDGASVYLGGAAAEGENILGGAVATFRRAPGDGSLFGVQTDLASFPPDERATGLVAAPNGGAVYATSGLATVVSTTAPPTGSLIHFERTAPDGMLQRRGEYRGNPPLGGGVLLSRDGAAAYRIAFDGLMPELRRFRRSAESGQLELVERLLAGGLTFGSALRTTSIDDALVLATTMTDILVYGEVGGAWTLRQTLPLAEPEGQMLGPIAAAPEGQHLYAGVCEGFIGAIVTLSQASNGMLAVGDRVRGGSAGVAGLGCPSAIALSPDGRRLYAATSDVALLVFDRDVSSGALTFRSSDDDVVGAGEIVLSPDAAHLYLTGFGVLARYDLNAVDGAATFAGFEQGDMPSGGPIALAMSPLGDFVFLSDVSFDGFLAAFARDTTTGVLSQQQRLSGVANLALSPDGRFVYGNRLGDRAILILAVAD